MHVCARCLPRTAHAQHPLTPADSTADAAKGHPREIILRSTLQKLLRSRGRCGCGLAGSRGLAASQARRTGTSKTS